MIQNFAIIGSVVVSAMGAIFGLYQARKADKSATTTKTIELGVTQLIDQYRKSNQELAEEQHNCNERCAALELKAREQDEKIEYLQDKVDTLESTIEEKDTQIFALKMKYGEPLA